MSDRNDPDERWVDEFDRLKKAGKVVLDRDEWKAKLEDAYQDGRASMDSELTHAYANGRADEREQISELHKEMMDALLEWQVLTSRPGWALNGRGVSDAMSKTANVIAKATGSAA